MSHQNEDDKPRKPPTSIRTINRLLDDLEKITTENTTLKKIIADGAKQKDKNKDNKNDKNKDSDDNKNDDNNKDKDKDKNNPVEEFDF
tara:strand:- start:264 stop:527 length:264 start_codon:yes stop_codon:yes gene_type:complete